MLAAAASVYVLVDRGASRFRSCGQRDDPIFLTGAHDAGWLAIFAPYGGQLLLFQRTVAFLAAPLPTLIQPAIYVAASIAVALASTGIVLSNRWRHPVPLAAQFVCLLALLCSPQVDDAFGTLSNAHWWLAVGVLSLGMLRDPLGRLGRMGELAYTAIASLSAGFAAVYGFPMLVVRAVRNRSRHSAAILAAAVVGALIQMSYLLSSSRHGDIGPIISDPGTSLLVFIKRVLATDALGTPTLAVMSPLKTVAWQTWLVVIVLAAALAFIWIRALREETTRLEAAALGVTIAGGWLLAMWAFTMPGASLDMLFWPTAGARYFVVPTAAIYLILLLWQPGSRARLAGACLGRHSARGRDRGRLYPRCASESRLGVVCAVRRRGHNPLFRQQRRPRGNWIWMRRLDRPPTDSVGTSPLSCDGYPGRTS